jgi:hypothetical protein
VVRRIMRIPAAPCKHAEMQANTLIHSGGHAVRVSAYARALRERLPTARYGDAPTSARARRW